MAICTVQSRIINTTSIRSYIAVASLEVIPTIFAIFGNGLCLIAFIKTRRLYSPSNLLVGMLCLSDFVVGLTAKPLLIATCVAMTTGYPFQKIWLASEITTLTGCGFSTFLFSCITLDRYLAICHSLRYYSVATIKKYALVIAVFFPICILLPLLTFYMLDKNPYLFGAITIFVVFSLISFIYVMIYKAILHQRSTIITVGTFDGSCLDERRKRKEEKDKAYTIGIILLLFLICYIPSSTVAFKLYDAPLDPCNLSPKALNHYLWAQFFLLLNSAVNPIIYSFRSKELRDAIRRLFRNSFFIQRLVNSNEVGSSPR